MTLEVEKILQAIADDILTIVKAVFADNDISENIKVHKNTLVNSHIDKDTIVNLRNENNPMIDIILNQYIEYIERGRERWHTPKVPWDALRDWAREKLGKADNTTLYFVQKSIYEKGIRPRPILHYVFEEIDKKWNNNWGDDLFQSIIKDLIEYFNK